MYSIAAVLFTALVASDPLVAQSVRFAVIGDYGSRTVDKADQHAEKAVAALVKGWKPDFVVTVGDNNYECGAAATIASNVGHDYCDYIYNPGAPSGQLCSGKAATDKTNRFFPALGNHDWFAANAQPYLDYFTALPGNRRYYDVQQGPLHLFALDSEAPEACQAFKKCNLSTSGCTHEPDGADAGSKQAQWLQAKLKTSKAPWKLVFFHHPPYSCSSKESAAWMRWPFQEWGVNAVLAGHHHVYERYTQINQPDFPYFINGVGGIELTSCKSSLDPKLFNAISIAKHNGAMLVLADSSKITFTFTVTDGSSVSDNCVLKKSGSGQTLTCGK